NEPWSGSRSRGAGQDAQQAQAYLHPVRAQIVKQTPQRVRNKGCGRPVPFVVQCARQTQATSTLSRYA
ncbi:MAG: hypothetical protein Q7T05_01125, partial [Dehalococcoidia bacterium]|nr:hypothetical protein [Dehalococcoidia bacterium]